MISLSGSKSLPVRTGDQPNVGTKTLLRDQEGPKAICCYSGGLSSFLAAKRYIEAHGKEGAVLLFCDTGEEDLDLYRFAMQGAAVLGVPLFCLMRSGGMDAVLDSHRALPNNRMPFCSRDLKVEMARGWVHEFAPGAKLVYGIGWHESHRVANIQKRWPNHEVLAPMCARPYLTHEDMRTEVEALGLAIPALYLDGFAHNNCGGACVRAGIAAWTHTYRHRPEVFQKWIAREDRVSAMHGKTYSILRDRTGGTTKPLPLRMLAQRIEANALTLEESSGCHGGCGCFSDDGSEE